MITVKYVMSQTNISSGYEDDLWKKGNRGYGTKGETLPSLHLLTPQRPLPKAWSLQN